MKRMTDRQAARQADEYRTKGRYAKVNPCYGCGKSAGISYYSHPLTDVTWGDCALVLCGKCCDATEHMQTEEEFMEYARAHGGATPRLRAKSAK